MSNLEEMEFEIILEIFNKKFMNYFDFYKDCILYPIHIDYLCSIISEQKLIKKDSYLCDLIEKFENGHSYKFICN